MNTTNTKHKAQQKRIDSCVSLPSRIHCAECKYVPIRSTFDLWRRLLLPRSWTIASDTLCVWCVDAHMPTVVTFASNTALRWSFHFLLRLYSSANCLDKGLSSSVFVDLLPIVSIPICVYIQFFPHFWCDSPSESNSRLNSTRTDYCVATAQSRSHEQIIVETDKIVIWSDLLRRTFSVKDDSILFVDSQLIKYRDSCNWSQHFCQFYSSWDE